MLLFVTLLFLAGFLALDIMIKSLDPAEKPRPDPPSIRPPSQTPDGG
jgi:hypothetical protein